MKKNSLELIGADSMQAESGSRKTSASIPGADGIAVCFGARAAKSTFNWLILGVVLGFLLAPVCAEAHGAQSRASLAGLRIANGRRLTNGWAERFSLSNGMTAGSDDGILESAGVALFVSGLSSYLVQGSQQQPDNYAGLRGPDEDQRACEQHQLPLRLEFLAWLFFVGFVSWGGAVWIERR